MRPYLKNVYLANIRAFTSGKLCGDLANIRFGELHDMIRAELKRRGVPDKPSEPLALPFYWVWDDAKQLWRKARIYY